MWKVINDCGKQLTNNCRLRAQDDDQVKIYEVIEVEFDQYKLQLLTLNDQPTEKIELVLTCNQLLQYHFEVEYDQ